MNVEIILNEKGRNVVTANSATSLLDVARILTEHGIGCIVIVDEAEHVVGIVSERDIVRTVSANGPDILTHPVDSFMTKDVTSCNTVDTIDWVMSQMTVNRFRHMPVVEGGKLIGLVSIGDVVRQRIAEAELEAAAMREYIATG